MPWLLVVACAVGILLGLWMRIPSIVAASAALVLGCSVGMPLAGWSLLTALMYIFALLGALQCGYLIGVGLSLPWMTARGRARLPRNSTEVQRP
jgi:uncharacterized membrane protein AbrB (regulator of aidB expression)